MTLQVEASNTIPSTPSFYLQRHSRDVLNQTLPPILMRTVQRSFNKLCARRRERLGTRLGLAQDYPSLEKGKLCFVSVWACCQDFSSFLSTFSIFRRGKVVVCIFILCGYRVYNLCAVTFSGSFCKEYYVELARCPTCTFNKFLYCFSCSVEQTSGCK